MSETKTVFARNIPGTIKIPLDYPIQFGEDLIEELEVRPMNAGDQRRMKTEGNLPLPLVAELAMYLTGQPQIVIDEVTDSDLKTLNTVVLGFFQSSQKTL
jgi:hypothetical protein